MPRFIDQHPMKPFKAEQLRGLQKMKAVRKHHEKANVKADFIYEVETTT